jgi:peptidyl-prolyl cis-trans isomerase B (cyclophilin B)
VPSNKRQRELARRRAERQAARRVEERQRKRKRRTVLGLAIGGVAAAVVVILLLVSVLKSDKKKTDAKDTPTPTPSAAPVACGATAPPAPKKQTFKKEPAPTVDAKKTYTAHMKTSCGEIDFSMDPAKAPHTTNSFTFLAGKHFYDGTFCHRMTTSPGLVVLQCGDPEGTGAGGPGYTLPEENLKGAVYKRGLVAMAKTQAPHSTGSQFFLIDKDSQLPPQYTIVGKMTDASLTVLDKILAIGVAGAGGAPSTDGAPKQRVYIDTFTVEVK